MRIEIICRTVSDIINFVIALAFLFYISNHSLQKLKYLKNKTSFWHEIKCIFIIYKGISLTRIKTTFLEGDRTTFKLPVATSDSGFNFDLIKRSFRDLALRNTSRGGDVNTFEILLDFNTSMHAAVFYNWYNYIYTFLYI